MFRFKKILPFIMAIIMASGVSSTAFASEKPASKGNFSSVSLQKIGVANTKKVDLLQPLKIDMKACDRKLPKLDVKINGQKPSVATRNAVASTAPSNEIWKINGSVFAGNGNLTSSSDHNFYLVQITQPSCGCLKLSSSNPNLVACLCMINSDGTLKTTNLLAQANGSLNAMQIRDAGTYAIAILATSGTAGGSYTLMWNCSNPNQYTVNSTTDPSKNGTYSAKTVINASSDLARVVIFYNNNAILSNGTDIMSTLQWKLTETWYLPDGYTGREMIIDTITSRGTYLGTFSSNAPYSTNNALFIDVQRDSYLYNTSSYENNGQVIMKQDYTDPTGQQTPRTINYLAPPDSIWNDGKHNSYIVIDLNTFTVVDFLSSFNFYYTKDGGRTYTANITSRSDP